MVVGEFRRVSTRRLWSGGRMRQLRKRSRDVYDLLTHLITSPSSNFIGLCFDPVICCQAPKWRSGRVQRTLKILARCLSLKIYVKKLARERERGRAFVRR